MGCCGSKSVLLAERRAQLETFDDVTYVPKAEYDGTMDVIVRAFSGTTTQEGAADMQWALGEKFADLESPQRLDIIRFSMKMMLLKYVKDGAVVIRPHDNMKAVAVFTRSRGYYVPPCDVLSYVAISAGMMKEPQELRGTPAPSDVQKALEQLGKVEAEFHKKHGRGPHYLIQFAAVDPAAQGQGHSSKLLRRISELADAEGLPCLLFTTGPKHEPKKVAVYSRFGYQTVDERTITSKDGRCVTCYAMVRKAKPV